MLFRRKAEKIQAPKTEAKAKPVKKEPVQKEAVKKEPVKKETVKKEPAKKAAETEKKAPAKKVDLKEATRVYHVAKREDGMWAVKYAGGEKAIKLFRTQVEAVEYSKQMAANQGGKMLVHNSKGQNKGKIKSK